MASLIKRHVITKIRATDEQGVEHEFEGSGFIQLEGVGPDLVKYVDAHMRITGEDNE
jgi:hypothetical protein